MSELQVRLPVVIDFAKNTYVEVEVTKRSANGYIMEFYLLNQGKKIAKEDIGVITLKATTESGKIVFNDILVSEGECVEYEVSKTILAEEGRTTCVLQLMDVEGNTIHSFEWYVNVKSSLYDENAYVKQDDITAVRSYVLRAEDAANKSEEHEKYLKDAHETFGNLGEELKDAKENMEDFLREVEDKVKSGAFTGASGIQGPEGKPGRDGIVASVSGFYTLVVENGKLYVYYDGDEAPNFELTEDGKLYYIISKEKKTLIGEIVNDAVLQSEKGVAGGVASLDETGKVPEEQLPKINSYSSEGKDSFATNDRSVAYGEGAFASGVGSKALTESSVALGKQVSAGAKGYYILGIEETEEENVVALVLSEQQVKNAPPVDMRGGYNASEVESTKLDNNVPDANVGADIYIIVPNYHYTFCGTVSRVENDKLYVDNLTLYNYNSSVQSEENVFTFDDLVDYWKTLGVLDDAWSGTFENLVSQGLVGDRDYMVCIPSQPDWGTCEVTISGFAEGRGTCASGDYSHAEGRNSVVGGGYGHAEGRDTIAGYCAHAEGKSTKAKGRYSHAEGNNSTASASQSHAEGGNTIASGENSHAEGNGSKATNANSHAEGRLTEASGENSHAEGYQTVAHYRAHAEGGNTIASGHYSHAEGYTTTASGNYSHAENANTIASGIQSHAEGNGSKATGDNAHTEGVGTIASGNGSHAEGKSTEAKGEYSHTEGYQTKAGYRAHAEGGNTTASGHYSHAEGSGSKASGNYSHAENANTVASGVQSHAEGNGSKAIGDNSHAEGIGTIAKSVASHAQGKWNIEDTENKYAHIVGNGTNTARSNAHTVDWSGNASFAGSVKSNGEDYAEYFEWLDGNPDNEDRVGLLVALDGEKIRLANAGDEVLGVISGTVAVLGGNYEWEWNGKYLTDDFGRIIYEDVEEFVDGVTGEDEDGNPIIKKVSLGLFKRPVLNPNYDSTQEYVNRANRPEWDIVGMLGKLYVRDDGTCRVNGYITVGENGVATASSEKTNMRVLSRVNESVIRVLLK